MAREAFRSRNSAALDRTSASIAVSKAISQPGLTPRPQAEAETDPARPMEQKVDAKQRAENQNAVGRPMADDDQAEQRRHHAGKKDQCARMIGRELKAENDANNASGDETRAEHEGQNNA